MKRRRFRMCSLLVSAAVTVAAIVCAPAAGKACGHITHVEIADRAMRLLREKPEYADLVALLDQYPDTVKYGAMFPDWPYVVERLSSSDSSINYGNLAEAAHDTCIRDGCNPQFRNLLSNYLLPIYRKGAYPEWSNKTVAFLFGVISHQEADSPWHTDPGGLEPTAKIEELHFSNKDVIELMADEIVLNEFHPHANSGGWYIPLHAVQVIYETEGYPMTDAYIQFGTYSQGVFYAAENTGLVFRGYTWTYDDSVFGGGTKQLLDWTFDNIEPFEGGGLKDGANHTVSAWMEAWDWLTGYSPETGITREPAEPDGRDGWYVHDVSVSLTASGDYLETHPDPDPATHPDTTSGPFTTWYRIDDLDYYLRYEAPFTISGDGYHTIRGYSIDRNDLMEREVDFTFMIDATPPTISGAPTTLPNGNGWYRANVTVHFTASDALSGLDTLTPDVVLTQEGAGQSAQGVAEDHAGNVSSFTCESINIDKTPPVVDVTVDKAVYSRAEPLTIHVSGYDPEPGSGMASLTAIFAGQSVSDGQIVDLFWKPLGTYPLTVRGEDLAGLASEQRRDVELGATIEGLQGTLDRLCREGHITNPGMCRGLSARLSAAHAAMDRNGERAAAQMLTEFGRTVKAQTGKSIQAQAAALLLADGNALIADLRQ